MLSFLFGFICGVIVTVVVLIILAGIGMMLSGPWVG